MVDEELTDEQEEPKLEEGVEVEGEEIPEPDVNLATFQEMFPEMAGIELTPKAREALVMREVSRLRSAQAPVTEASDTTDPEVSALSRFASYDRDQVVKVVNKSIVEGDEDSLVELLITLIDGQHEQAELVNSALGRVDGQVETLSRNFTLEDALDQVPGSVAADIRTAKKIMENENVSSAKLGLELAMYRRVSNQPVTDVDAKAKRKASAISAARRGAGGDPTGSPRMSVGVSDEDFAKVMLNEIQEGGGSLIKK